MKKYDQVIISNKAIHRKAHFYLGSAICPVCFKNLEVIMPNDVKQGLAYVNPEARCKHAGMAVDAGRGQIAVDFIWDTNLSEGV